MLIEQILSSVITEEAAASWWMRRYTGTDSWVSRRGRITLAGTPLYDTNWLPSLALQAVIYRELQWPVGRIACALGKSHHAVTCLFARVDAAEVACG